MPRIFFCLISIEKDKHLSINSLYLFKNNN